MGVKAISEKGSAQVFWRSTAVPGSTKSHTCSQPIDTSLSQTFLLNDEAGADKDGGADGQCQAFGLVGRP